MVPSLWYGWRYECLFIYYPVKWLVSGAVSFDVLSTKSLQFYCAAVVIIKKLAIFILLLYLKAAFVNQLFLQKNAHIFWKTLQCNGSFVYTLLIGKNYFVVIENCGFWEKSIYFINRITFEYFKIIRAYKEIWLFISERGYVWMNLKNSLNSF